jgi:hypothetical protein
MKKRSGDGKKLINNGSRNTYNENDGGGGVPTLQREALAFG